ncbi:MAG: VanZ family protein [Candidatus Coatesbacteria bacterium]|nr:VanZ family protein [Candidatus Coatesbacteria bacterium]
MNKTQSFISIWKYPILYACLILLLTSIPRNKFYDEAEKGIPGEDKTLHVIAYIFLGMSTLKSAFIRTDFFKAILLALFSTSLFAAFDELHQIFIPGRFCKSDDALANIAGIVVGIIFGIVVYKIRKGIHEK